MLVPCETIPVPEAYDFDAARELVDEMCQKGLPAFTLHCAELDFPVEDNYMAIYKEFGETLADHGLSIYSYLPRFHSRYRYRDAGLHRDRDRSLRRVDEINFHYTTEGALTAKFLVHQSSFWKRDDTSPVNLYDMPQIHLEQGLVDDAIFVPRCYVAHVEAPQLLAFRLGGRNPLVHQFTSVDPRERETYLTIANRQSTPIEQV